MDYRDREAIMGKWYTSIDQQRMVVTIEVEGEDGCEQEVELPVEFQVCNLCEGQGAHVNPSIDAHGISSYEFYEDPDFASEYFGGTYDVTCYRCGGLRVEPEVNMTTLNECQKKWYKAFLDRQSSLADMYDEMEAERRMGC